MKAVEGRRGWSHTSPFEAPLGKHHYPAKPWILEPSIGWYQSGCQFGGLFCAVLCQFYCQNAYLYAEEPFPLCVLQSQMSFLPSGYPLKYRRSSGDTANSAVIGPLPLGNSFVSITYERSGEVVHHDHFPLANITFPISVPSHPDSPTSSAVEPEHTEQPAIFQVA
jgi:hypothetical protein